MFVIARVDWKLIQLLYPKRILAFCIGGSPLRKLQRTQVDRCPVNMFAVGMLGSYFTQGVYTVAAPFHPFGGAVDIIVVQQADGTFKSSPWYVQFGKFQGVLKGREKIVDISVNDVPVDFHMYLDHKGEAYFEKEARADEDTIQSPPSAPSSGDEMAEDGRIRLLNYSKTETGDELELLEAKNPETGVEALTVLYNGENLISGLTDHRNIEKANSDSAVWVSDDLVNQARTDVATPISETMVEGAQGIGNGSKGMKKREKTRSQRLEKAASEPSSAVCGLSFEETSRQTSGGPSSSEHGGSHLAPDVFKSGLSLEMAENAADRIDGRWRTGGEEIFLTPTWEEQTPPSAACISSKEPQLQERGSLAHCVEGVVMNEASHLKDAGNTASLTGDKCAPLHIEEETRKFPEVGYSQQPASLSPGDVESPSQVGLHRLDSFERGSTAELDDEYNEEDLFKSCLALEELQINTENDIGGPESEVCDSDFEVVHAGKILSSCDAADLYDSEQSSVNMDRSLVRGRSEPIVVPWVENEQRGDLTSSASLPARLYEGGIASFEQFYSQSVGSSPLSYIPQLHVKSDSSVISGGDLNGNIRLVGGQAADSVMYGSQKDIKEIARVSDAGRSSSAEVDLSLCKHLLSEGMGAEAAAMAFTSQKVCFEEFERSGPAIVANDKLVVKIGENYFSWVEAAPYILGMAAFGNKLANNIKGGIAVETVCLTEGAESPIGTLVPSATGWNLWPFSFRRSRVERSPSVASTLSTQASVTDTDVAVKSPLTEELILKNGYYKQRRKSKERTYVPTSAQLASLKLRDGPNKITFTFTTRVLGKTQVDARIHLWKWNTRIVISDVDGTITKSDVLGQVMPLVGRDWSQSGVTRLFSAIKENGYELLFLSARAISQAYLTRQFLLNLKQDGETLPDGPMFISPDGLFPSLYREVIRRAPHEFKISCLEGIRELFPSDVNPFYAGFGNRDTDEISYLKVGIPKGKIFIINPKGEVVVNHRVDVKTYTSLHMLVDDMFPPVSSCEQEDFNSWNFWKLPLADIDDHLGADSSRSTKKSVDVKGQL